MDLSQVKPLNIDDLIGKVKNRVALVGIELEGGWEKLPPGVPGLEHDGSVFGGRRPMGANYVGELPVGPIVPAGVAEIMTANFPQFMNATCGMHVHMSFDTLWYYQLLMVPSYQETMFHYLTRWAQDNKLPEKHCIWERLSGKNKYCVKEFWPDQQASKKQKDHNMGVPGQRYTAIHYCGRQNTIECRILPMINNKKRAISAVEMVIAITNACIYELGKTTKRDKFQSKVSFPDNTVYEETIIETL